jgi:hypothetical protein
VKEEVGESIGFEILGRPADEAIEASEAIGSCPMIREDQSTKPSLLTNRGRRGRRDGPCGGERGGLKAIV